MKVKHGLRQTVLLHKFINAARQTNDKILSNNTAISQHMPS